MAAKRKRRRRYVPSSNRRQNERYATPAREDTPAGRASQARTDLAVFEEPGPANNWEKLVVRVNSPKLTSFVVQWKNNAR